MRRTVRVGRLGPRDVTVTAVGLVAATLLVVPLDMMMTIKADGTTVPIGIGIETTTGIVVTVLTIRTTEGEMKIESGIETAAIDLEMRDTAARDTRLTRLEMTETETETVIATLVGVVAMIRG